MGSATKEVVGELPNILKIYSDGSAERLCNSPYAPPSPVPDPEIGVVSKDITISKHPQICARLYLPTLTHPDQKLPLLVYYHGGAFVMESAFGSLFHRYLEKLVSEAKVVVVSVEYRLAPEHPLPICYQDCWAALQWAASHSTAAQQQEQGNSTRSNFDSWLLNHADFHKLYLGGESSGGNIVHNILMRAGEEGLAGGLRVCGAFLGQPFFWGSEPVGSEPDSLSDEERALAVNCWRLSHPTAENGVDNEMINPVGKGKRSLKGLGCSKILVHVAGKDPLRERGIWYFEAVKMSGWDGEVELMKIDGEDHAFHLVVIDRTDNGRRLMSKLASFLNTR